MRYLHGLPPRTMAYLWSRQKGPPKRTAATGATSTSKKEGDISDAFASLSGMDFKPLDSRFASLKSRLVAGNEEALHASWNRLLASLREEIPLIASLGPRIVPEIDFRDIDNASPEFRAEHRKRGVAVIRNVLPEQEALDLKQELREYIAANPQVRPPSILLWRLLFCQHETSQVAG